MLSDSEKKPSIIYVISDTHIGGEKGFSSFEAKRELIAFLHQISDGVQKDVELVIAGDFLNLWEIESRKGLEKIRFIIQENKDLFLAFRRASKSIRVTVIPGNHDQELAFMPGSQEELAKWGIVLIQEEAIVRFLGGKKIQIEHGHRFDHFNRVDDFKNPAATSYGYHIRKNIFLKIARIAQKNKKNNFWLKDLICFQPINLGFSWVFSNYFYRELAPILRYLVAFFLMMTSISLVLLFWAIGTRLGVVHIPNVFYFTSFLGPVRYLANFVIVLGFVFVVFALVFYFVFKLTRKDLLKNLEDYDIAPINDWSKKRELDYYKKVRRFLRASSDTDLFVLGHSHAPKIERMSTKQKIFFIADSGSWLKSFKPIRSWFRLPSVYLPFFDFSYLKIEKKDSGIQVLLDFKIKKSVHSLTFLEKISIMFKNKGKAPRKKAVLIS